MAARGERWEFIWHAGASAALGFPVGGCVGPCAETRTHMRARELTHLLLSVRDPTRFLKRKEKTAEEETQEGSDKD